MTSFSFGSLRPIAPSPNTVSIPRPPPPFHRFPLPFPNTIVTFPTLCKGDNKMS